MKPLAYSRAASLPDALRDTRTEGHRPLGGGPLQLVDVTGLSADIGATADGGLMIGGATTNSAVAGHPLVRARYPVLARAILSGASAQIRNMATVDGNLMQRTRCLYFQDVKTTGCNQRHPGSGCDAHGRFRRHHAIVVGSTACIATHPSDICVALAALDAVVHVSGPAGTRIIAFGEFHRLPGDTPTLEKALQPGELIVAVALPPPTTEVVSAYRKVRDRASYAFALVSVAVIFTMRDRHITDLRIVFGGIIPKPWRALRAEAARRGGPASDQAIHAAGIAEFGQVYRPAGRSATPADYHTPTHLDVPEIEVMWTAIADPRSALGACGIGEIGVTGVGAAIANAVFNAVGTRVRELPIPAPRQTDFQPAAIARRRHFIQLGI